MAQERGDRRSIAFDPRFSHRLASRELLEECLGEAEVQTQATALEVQDDLPSLLRLVPEQYRAMLGPGSPRGAPPLSELRDIVLDVGARPRAFFGR